jgi:hypothetical protein
MLESRYVRLTETIGAHRIRSRDSRADMDLHSRMRQRFPFKSLIRPFDVIRSCARQSRGCYAKIIWPKLQTALANTLFRTQIRSRVRYLGICAISSSATCRSVGEVQRTLDVYKVRGSDGKHVKRVTYMMYTRSGILLVSRLACSVSRNCDARSLIITRMIRDSMLI